MIEHEDKSQPLSDQNLCNQLKNVKIEISRRTVAKYREEMGIWSSEKRKVYDFDSESKSNRMFNKSLQMPVDNAANQ